jgi:hypothetical protein
MSHDIKPTVDGWAFGHAETGEMTHLIRDAIQDGAIEADTRQAESACGRTVVHEPMPPGGEPMCSVCVKAWKAARA